METVAIAAYISHLRSLATVVTERVGSTWRRQAGCGAARSGQPSSLSIWPFRVSAALSTLASCSSGSLPFATSAALSIPSSTFSLLLPTNPFTLSRIPMPVLSSWVAVRPPAQRRASAARAAAQEGDARPETALPQRGSQVTLVSPPGLLVLGPRGSEGVG